MNWKEMLDNGWFVRVVLVLWLVSAVFVVYLLVKVDWIVHNQLYGFGLQFSPEWAVGYWAMMRAIYFFLATPVFLSAAYFGLEVWLFVKRRRGGFAELKPKQSVKTTPARQKVAAVEQNHMLVSCPKCRRVFSKPLVMLDFSGGKTRFVNVCPYCNHVLGCAEEEAAEKKKDD
ncbi:MAG: hypothetical protein ACUVQW_03415, partial [Candidatus Bathycorpusculaceae bacterium]